MPGSLGQETKLGIILGSVKKKGPAPLTKAASSLLVKWKKGVLRDSGEQKRKRETTTKEPPAKKAAVSSTFWSCLKALNFLRSKFKET